MSAQEGLDPIIQLVREGQDLSADQAESAFARFMDGSALPDQMAELLLAMREKGYAASEVAGGVRALRGAMIGVDVGDPAEVTDTCGTGGGTVTTFNISTAAAFVAAAGGARVAKHGNRSFTSRSGSADVLEALGIPIELSPSRLEAIAEEVGIVFLYAPAHHPAMRHVGPIRRQLGVTTIMNILGPLANPARARRQVVGVADPALLALIAASLRELGHVRALVAYGEPGLDELSPIGATRIAVLDGGTIEERIVDPDTLGVDRHDPGGMAGGSPTENAARIRSVLSGEDRAVAREATTLNAGAALFVAGLAPTLEAGVVQARVLVDSGAALETLHRYREAAGGR